MQKVCQDIDLWEVSVQCIVVTWMPPQFFNCNNVFWFSDRWAEPIGLNLELQMVHKVSLKNFYTEVNDAGLAYCKCAIVEFMKSRIELPGLKKGEFPILPIFCHIFNTTSRWKQLCEES